MLAEVGRDVVRARSTATGIASILVKIASGSVERDDDRASRRGADSPLIDLAVPPLKSLRALDREEELRGAALGRGCERALPAVRRRCAR